MGDAVGRRGDAGSVRDGGDGAERLRWLSVRGNLAIGGVHANDVLKITLAAFKGTILGVVGHIVGTADAVVGVEAVGSRDIVLCGVAYLEAESSTAHEAGKE